MKNKITLILSVILLIINLIGCGNQTYKSQETANRETANQEASEQNDTDSIENEYFSVLEPTDNNGLRFNITLGDFIENYNKSVIAYANAYEIVNKAFVVGADFKKQNGSQPDTYGALCDMYMCNSTLFGYNENLGICVSVEKESHKISYVSIAVDSSMQDSFSKDQVFLYTLQHHIVYRALVNELSLEDCYSITEGIDNNSKIYNISAYFEKGIAFCLDYSYEQSIGIRYTRIQPCTRELWKSSPGFKDIPID